MQFFFLSPSPNTEEIFCKISTKYPYKNLRGKVRENKHFNSNPSELMQPLPCAMVLVAIVILESFKSIKTPRVFVIMEFIKLLWFLFVCQESGSCFCRNSFQICPLYFPCSVLRLCCCRCHISHKLQK